MSLLGLRLVVYEKTKHFHGMIFRKPSVLLQSLTAASVESVKPESSLDSLFFIPQDRSDVTETDQEQTSVITEQDREYFKESFQELPNFDL